MMVGRADKILESFSAVLRKRGVVGLYIGLKPTLARDIVFSSIQLPIFEMARRRISQHGLNSIASGALGGMVAACIAGFISCPFDVVKTRLMTQKMDEEGHKKIITQIYQEFGVKGFFRGVEFRCGILMFGASVYFSALMFGRKLLKIE
jgi:solute carrier family 25 protein 39/40